MDDSFHEQGSHTQQDPKSFLVSLPILGNLIKWLASLSQWTEEEHMSGLPEQRKCGLCRGIAKEPSLLFSASFLRRSFGGVAHGKIV